MFDAFCSLLLNCVSFSQNLVKLGIIGNCSAGELTAAELDNLMVIVANPRQFKIPDWFLNRKKDYKDGKYSQVVSNALDMKLRDDLERLKKIRYTYIYCPLSISYLLSSSFEIFFQKMVRLLDL